MEPRRHSRHGELNDIIHRSLVSAKVPSRIEPTGLLRLDSKRPDGMTIIPWSSGRLLVWDATCCDTFAFSHVRVAVSGAGAVAAKAEETKRDKYSHREASFLFVPVAVETCGAFGPEAGEFFRDLGRWVKRATDEANAYQYSGKELPWLCNEAMQPQFWGHLAASMDWETYELLIIII